MEEKIMDFKNLMGESLSHICFKGTEKDGKAWATIGLRDLDQRYIDLITSMVSMMQDIVIMEGVDPIDELIDILDMDVHDFMNHLADGYDLDQELWPEIWEMEDEG